MRLKNPLLSHTDAIGDSGDGYEVSRTRVEGPSARSVPGWHIRCLWCDWEDSRHLQKDAVAEYRQHENRVLALERWNDRYPIGTPVSYWPADRIGEGVQSVTRSVAWCLGSGQPVVSVEGYAGGIALSHVEAHVAAGQVPS